MSRSWRDWKCRVKKNGYHAYETNEERLANRPNGVIAEQWSSLVAMWNLEKSQVSKIIFLPSFTYNLCVCSLFDFNIYY